MAAALHLPGRLGFGGAPLGNLMAPVAETDATGALQAAWDGGVRYYDTAPMYGAGLSEQRLGGMLRRHPRDAYMLSTKVGRLLDPDDGVADDQNAYVGGLKFRVRFDYTPDAIRRSLDDSLRRLGIDRIDIAFIHDLAEDTHGPAWRGMWAQHFPAAAATLSRLREERMIGGWGLGTNSVEPCARALEEADPDIFLLAGRYTLLEHAPLEAVFPACMARGVRVVIGGPYNSGLLAGGDNYNYAPAPADMLARRQALLEVCSRHGVDIRAAALQFCAAHPVVACTIPGARNAAEVAQNIALMQAPLPAAFWQDLRQGALIPADAPTP